MYEQNYHKTVLKTDTKQGKKRTGINWKLVIRLVITAVVITTVIVLTRLPRLQVRTITVVGANVADPGDISEFVQEQLQGNRAFIFPKSSIFLVPEHTLEKQIKQQFSRLQTVTVSRTNFSTLTISVTEFQGMYLWCTDETTCDFMDQNGIAFAAAPYFSGNAYPKIFIGTVQPLPFQALTSTQTAMVALLLTRLPVIGIVPEEFHFVSDHEVDMDFTHNAQQAQIIFDPTMDTNDSLEALYTGLRTDPLMTNFHDQTKLLQYIDLRYENRVVYKFQ
jgi:cell division septal protein FtsQ